MTCLTKQSFLHFMHKLYCCIKNVYIDKQPKTIKKIIVMGLCPHLLQNTVSCVKMFQDAQGPLTSQSYFKTFKTGGKGNYTSTEKRQHWNTVKSISVLTVEMRRKLFNRQHILNHILVYSTRLHEIAQTKRYDKVPRHLCTPKQTSNVKLVNTNMLICKESPPLTSIEV